jgi:hypothetical protein
MKLLLKASLGSLIALVVLAGTNLWAQGQTPAGTPPPRRSPVSPYIDLAGQRGGNAAFQYYRRIQPELQMRSSIQNVQQQLNVTQSEVAEIGSAVGPRRGTGHSTQFMNLSGYFMSSGRAQASGGRAASTPAAGSRSGARGRR